VRADIVQSHRFAALDPMTEFRERSLLALSPGSRGFQWSKTPRKTATPQPRSAGQDKIFGQQHRTVVTSVERSPRKYTTSFSSEQLRLAQMRRPCRAELSTPVPYRFETEDVAPGSYDAEPPAFGEPVHSSFFRSTTPQLTLYSDPTKTDAFLRSNANVLGPGSYDSRALQNSRPITGFAEGSRRPMSSFKSKLPQQVRTAKPLSLDHVIKPKPGTLSTSGYTWSRKPRVTQTVAARDPGRDNFYDNSTRSIGWSISNGSGLRVG